MRLLHARASQVQRAGARFVASLLQLRFHFAPLTAPLSRAFGRSVSRPRMAWPHNRKETKKSNEQTTAAPAYRILSIS
jgi:hypothetical protein